jgi:hypothetical protein
MTSQTVRAGSPREHQRFTLDAFVRVHGADHEFILRTRDLSRGGLFLYTKVGHMYPFHQGSALAIELFDFDRTVAFQAVVVRVVEPGSQEASNYPTGFGVRIVSIDDENRERLDKLIERATKGQSSPY